MTPASDSMELPYKVAESTVSSANIGKAIFAESTVSSTNIEKAKFAESTVSSMNIEKAIFAESTISSVNIENTVKKVLDRKIRPIIEFSDNFIEFKPKRNTVYELKLMGALRARKH